jgi:hypothetical protein
MRKNTEQVINAFLCGESKNLHSIKTDGTTIFSYDTAILTRGKNGYVIYNGTRYTNTTSQQQNAIFNEFNPGIVVSNIARGATADDLRKAAGDL